MKLLVISSAPFITKTDGIYGYSPYVKEMEVWRKNVDELIFCCPYWKSEGTLLVTKIPFKVDAIYSLQEFNFTTVLNAFKALPIMVKDCIQLYKKIKKADAIHLRCPGNIGLLACFIQILFPNKMKSAKYAGNWDSDAKQPLSYKLQKWILSSTFLTQNMKVLVYGEWNNQSKNIKSFFTATYFKSEIIEVQPRNLKDTIKIIFVGMLSKGKQPLYAIQIVQELKKRHFDVELSFYGDGQERAVLEEYIAKNNLNSYIFIKGNTDRASMKTIYQSSHFLILPSKSEGWPKVVAEAMFWGCLPISTKVSCIPNMLDYGNRGVLLNMNIEDDTDSIKKLITNVEDYNSKLKKAQNWSQNYTIDRFKEEIKLLLQS
jgi:glycosyltransferase involved in cell wall biosynthesis